VLTELRLEEAILRPGWLADEKPEMDLPEEAKELQASVKVSFSLTFSSLSCRWRAP
jgi:hypothetical protein